MGWVRDPEKTYPGPGVKKAQDPGTPVVGRDGQTRVGRQKREDELSQKMRGQTY
jgi:hypothetical protein